MKRKFKRIASLVLAAVMVFAMAMPTMAATITMTGDNVTGHTYKVYQIFTGDVAGTDAGEGEANGEILSNVKYGQNYVPEEKSVGDPVDKTTLEALAAMTGNDLAADFLTEGGTYNVTGDAMYTLPVDESYTLSDVPAGYYIIQDVTEGTNVAYSAYMVEVVTGTVTITPKATDVPEFEKKVKEEDDSTTGTTTDWQDGADYDIGDTVPFKLEATLPGPQDQFDRYETYKLVFHDEMSDGLTLDSNLVENIKVTKVDGTTEAETSINDGFEVQINPGDGCAFHVTFNDVKGTPINAKSGDKIRIEFNATLNADAEIGEAGNPNTGSLEYSNNPDNDGTGKTPDDTVKVYTFDVKVKKVDENNEALTGAGFTLYKWTNDDIPGETRGDFEAPTNGVAGGHWSGSPEQVGGPDFDFKGLDSGIYKLVETTTPPGYNTYAPVDFTIKAEYNNDDNKPEGPTLTGVTITSSPDNEFNQAPVGTFTITIKNQKGTTLPETGGIGTTIFYVVGSVLVLGAVILLVTKRRMKSE